MKVSVLGEFNASMLYLMLTIFNDINELRLLPIEEKHYYYSTPSEDFSELSELYKVS
jgi:hypothetical protein